MADVEPVDYTTDVGKVRLLIPDCAQILDVRDPNVKSYMLSDDQITALLALCNNSIRLAAAEACALIGRDDLLIGKVITQTDFATDASKVSAQMLAHAKDLREQAALAGETMVPDVDTLVLTPGVPLSCPPYPGELLPYPWYTGAD